MKNRFFQAVGFLTTLPLPGGGYTLEGAARGIPFYPLVGVVLGVILSLVVAFALAVWGASVAAVLVVVAWVLLTGGLHLDGLSDLMDGIGGARERDKALSIMRDSRIGVFGALSLICHLALKGVVLHSIILSDPEGTLRVSSAIVLSTTLGRLCIVQGIVLFPYARHEGAGLKFKEAGRFSYLVAGSGTAMLAGLVLFGVSGLVIAAITSGAMLVVANALSLRLRGLTGDAYGALAEAGELLTLLTIAAFGGALVPMGLILS